ncbi:MAG TPA: ankyrin repeat domain-containing protein [Pyrinomonadaceae bacterium]|nr:ankyrin repeat domain-containing protein [Pyrinomonadaceae bacterium]
MSSSFSLTNAVTSGDESTVSALLANGADVNETTNGGQTALILAVISGHTNLVRMLMNAGANPQLRDNLGLNAVEWAQRRGLNEAYAILTTPPEPSTRSRRIVIPVEQTEKPPVETPSAPRNDEVKSTGPDDGKSRRWVEGVKQRLDEQAMRRLNRNELPLERPPVREEPPPPPEPPRETIITGAPRILAPPPIEPGKSGKRKRCPQCNEIYNADLVAYCSQHMVPLVDLDAPIVTEVPKTKNGPLFWILLVITLAGSLVLGSLITTYVYKANQTAAPAVAEPQNTVQKGTPEVSTELAGKAVSLPEAECPMRGAETISGTVTVRILVDKSGQVSWARGSGGDWLMRGCSTEAAMKSTFDPQKLRSREVEGTITYTFKP